jgi:hypothetical protein
MVHRELWCGVGREMFGDHVLHVKETHFSWGADAAAYEILLFLAQWAATSAAWDAAKALAMTMQRRIRVRAERTDEAVPLTDEDVERRALNAITDRYAESPDNLKLISAELRGASSASVVFRAASSWTYECDLEVFGEEVSITRIRRSR